MRRKDHAHNDERHHRAGNCVKHDSVSAAGGVVDGESHLHVHRYLSVDEGQAEQCGEPESDTNVLFIIAAGGINGPLTEHTDTHERKQHHVACHPRNGDLFGHPVPGGSDGLVTEAQPHGQHSADKHCA